VTGDAAGLAQVVANLLANTRTHTPPGTTVAVTLTPVDGRVSVTVVDDGPGVPPDLLPHVFERFARGDSSRSRAHGSTGLGLSIVDAVIAAHGGTVNVTSIPGRTAFTVELPGPQLSHRQAPRPGDPAPRHALRRVVGGRRTVGEVTCGRRGASGWR
jgi:two-component system OmpR family sensor kinase